MQNIQEKETLKQREKRKRIWIARACAQLNTPELRKEAEALFNKKNPV